MKKMIDEILKDSDGHPKLVLFENGEIIEFVSDSADGVEADDGHHEWSEVEAFLVWNKASERYFSIPIK